MGADNETKITEPVEGEDKSAQVAVEETAEAKITRLEAERGEIAQQLEQWKRDAKAHQATALKQGSELKRMREQTPRSDGTNKAVLDILKEQFGDDPRITNLQEQLTREERMAQCEKLTQDARAELETKIESAGLSVDDERLDTVWDAFKIAYNADGNFEDAKKRLDRTLSKLTPKKEVKEDEEEIARRVMERKGLLKTDANLPSGDSLVWEQARDAFIKDPRDPGARERYLGMRKERKR